jgi:hypothetical protein
LPDELPVLQDFCKGEFGQGRAHEHIELKAIDFELAAGVFPGETFDSIIGIPECGKGVRDGQLTIYIPVWTFNRCIHIGIERLVGPHYILAIFPVEIKRVTCVRTFYPGSIKSGFGTFRVLAAGGSERYGCDNQH